MESWIPIITGLGGLGAIALFFREIVAIAKLLRNGVAARESKRRNDIIAQRDAAIAERDAANKRAAEAEKRTDRERANRRVLETHAAHLEVALIRAGGAPNAWPDIDETTEITKT